MHLACPLAQYCLIGLQPTKTRAELDSSKQIFYEYHPLSIAQYLGQLSQSV